MNHLNDPWVRAIHESTACLRIQHQGRRSVDESTTLTQSLDTASAFLDILEDQLVHASNNDENSDSWNHPPSKPPPSWTRFSQAYTEDKAMATREATRGGSQSHPSRVDSYDDDDDDDAGDVPIAFGMNDGMDCRRLHIRILTCQSEIFASKASLFASKDCKDFREGANQLQLALAKIHQALKVADSEISKWFAHMENAQFSDAAARTKEKDALVEDANIVEVATQNMTQRREKLLSLCQQEQNWLLRKLEPQWESRNEVKERVGAERWKNNPNPKNDYAEQRREYEDRLRAVRLALEALQALDPTMAMERANNLQYQLQYGVRREEGNAADSGHEPVVDEATILSRRYNGLRPTSEWLSRRVDIQQYPDPTNFGWIFTGSWQAVEFFERTVVHDSTELVVKLDWYFTTATIKTALDHPTQGKTQLFGKQVGSSEFKKILTNPRVHTGNRYQRRRHRSGGRGRGGGRHGDRTSRRHPANNN